MEALGAAELADMFNTIVKLCELDEQSRNPKIGFPGQLQRKGGPDSASGVRQKTGGVISYTWRNDSAIMVKGCS